MESIIVDRKSPVTLLGAGKLKKKTFRAAIGHAPTVVAADGGARWAVRHGINLSAVIGDFDSISAGDRAAISPDIQHPVAEQDSTDFEKCLSRITAPLVIGVGFGGGRLDHQLAVLHGLLRYPDRRCIVLNKRELVFLAPPALALDLAAGTRVSLFPLAPVVARSQGLHWSLGGQRYTPGQLIGTSNRAIGGEVRLETDAPGGLVILPVRELAQVVAALTSGAPACWPSSRTT